MNRSGSTAQLGVIASITSSALFAAVFVLSAFLDVSADQLFGWRTFFTLAMLVLFLTVRSRWGGITVLARRIRARPWLGVALAVTAASLGFQQWLFVWAPGAGRGLPVALGYFMMPIMLAIVGRVVFRERLGPWRITAVAVAAAAVLYQVLTVGGISWETLVVALGYPVYFTVRRLAAIGGSSGLTAETALALPVALVLMWLDDPGFGTLRDPGSVLRLTAFALLAAVALLLYIAASGMLPLTVFGLLSYLEPIGLALAAAFVLGEPLPPEELPTYIAIAVALLLLAVESFRRRRPPRNQPLIS